MFKVLACVISRDLRLAGYHRSEWIQPFLFFVMIVSVFPIALGRESGMLLVQISPAIIWIAVILSLLMSLAGMFQADHQEGIVEQYVLSPYPLSWLLFGKSLAHVFMFGFPLWLLALLSGVCLNMSPGGLWALGVTLALGVPTLSVMGSLMAALTLGLPQGGVLLSVLALPLMIPVLIFGTSGVEAASQGISFHAQIFLLLAMFVLVWVLGPISVSAALKTSVE